MTRVLFIGLDSVDKDIVRSMCAAGKLPTLARLLRDGTSADTTNPVGLFVGALWSSFATATTPARHGRHSPRQLVPGTYEARPLSPAELRRPPFWRALAATGRRCAVIDVPHTCTDERSAGIQIVEWGSHDPAYGFTTWPPSAAGEIVARFGRHPVHPDPEGNCDVRRSSAADYLAFRAALLEGVERKATLTTHVLARNDWDLAVTVFCEGHCANHQCWHLRDPSHPLHDPAVAGEVGDVLARVYEALDAAVARLLAEVGDDTTVFVLASHGAQPHYDASFTLDRILRLLESSRLPLHQRMLRGAFAALWQGLPTHRQMRHPRFYDRLWRGYEELPPLDPAKRRWFKVDNNEPYGGIRINLAGREPLGMVQPADFDVSCRELTDELLAIVNLETGQPVAQRVLRTAEIYEGEHLDMLPDLLVEWARDAPVRLLASPKIGRLEVESTDLRTGDHRPDGLLLACGPGMASGAHPPIAITDIGPTIAALLGVDLADVDGRVVEALAVRST